VQCCRETLKLVEFPKLEFLEGGEEEKGVLLLLGESLHLFSVGPIKLQVGEGRRQEAANGHSKESRGVIRIEPLQFG